MKVARMKSFQKMHAEEPCTEEAADGLKYGPCKFDLVKEFSESCSMDWEACAQQGDVRILKKLTKAQKKRKEKSTGLSQDARKARMLHVFRGVARRLHGKDLKVWVDACGRSVSHKLGPVMFLLKKHIIQKLRRSQKKVSSHDIIDVSQAGGQGKYVLCPLRKNVPKQVEEMMSLADGICTPELKKVPRTIAQVAALLKAAAKAVKMKAKKVGGGNYVKKKKKNVKKVGGKDYVKHWFMRARVTRMLYLARRRLQLGSATVAQLSRIVPDSGNWMEKFSVALGMNPKKALAQTLFDRMGYTGEAHVFSMWACLFADRAFMKVSAEKVAQNPKEMEKFAIQHRQKHKIWPHPAQAYTMVREMQKSKAKKAKILLRKKK